MQNVFKRYDWKVPLDACKESAMKEYELKTFRGDVLKLVKRTEAQ